MTIDLVPNLDAREIAAALILAHIPFSVDMTERGAVFNFTAEHRADAEELIASLVPDK